MELKINIDLEAAIATALDPEKLGPILQKGITEAVVDAINGVTGYRSQFREEAKRQLAEAMPHGLHLRDVAKFQHVLNAVFSDAVLGVNGDTVRAALSKAVAVVMPDAPTVIKLSDLIKEARHDFHKDEDGEAFYALYEPSEYGGGRLYLDSKASPGKGYGVEKYAADFCVSFTSDGEVYSMKLEGKQLTPASLTQVVSSFDSTLLSMYVGRTRLEVDIDADDVADLAGEQERD